MLQTTVVSIISPKGGVGKTSLTVNLAAALNSFGRSVLVIDGNYTKPNIGLHLGLTKQQSTIHGALKGNHTIKEAIVLHPSGIQVIIGSIVYEEMHALHPRRIENIVSDLRGYAEVILMDSGPGISQELFDILEASDKAILLTTPDLSAITDALRAKQLCKDKGVEILGLVVTHTSKESKADMTHLETIFTLSVIGEIPYDPDVPQSQKSKYPVVYANPNAKATIGYKKLAGNLVGEPYEDKTRGNPFEEILQRLGFK
jgi:septum site-determining protein MinD